MASGLHWEWRGFGGVTSRFIKNYCDLPLLFKSQTVEDLYLWIPGLEVNAKFRTGAEGGLKFKRIKENDKELEKWFENPDEIFDFPLEAHAWETLSNTLNTVNIDFPEYPSKAPTRQQALDYLIEAGCKTLLVKKHRESRIWNGLNESVKIEWACISEPQSLISIGIENRTNYQSDDLNDDMIKDDIKAAIDTFDLGQEPLKIMNYMDAIEIWSSDKKI